MLDMLAKGKATRNDGEPLNEVLAVNLTVPYAKRMLGATKSSQDRFVTQVFDEVRIFRQSLTASGRCQSVPVT